MHHTFILSNAAYLYFTEFTFQYIFLYQVKNRNYQPNKSKIQQAKAKTKLNKE